MWWLMSWPGIVGPKDRVLLEAGAAGLKRFYVRPGYFRPNHLGHHFNALVRPHAKLEA